MSSAAPSSLATETSVVPGRTCPCASAMLSSSAATICRVVKRSCWSHVAPSGRWRGEDDAPPLLSERVFEGDDVCMLWLDWQVCFNEPPLDRVGEIEGVHDGHDATAIMRALVPNGSWCAMLPAAFACESETAVATVALPRRLDAHRLGGRHAVARAGSG